MLTKMNLFWTIFWTSESCVTSFSAPDGSQMQRSADCPQTNRNNCHNFPHLQEEQHVPFVYNPNETTVTTFPTYRRNGVCRLSHRCSKTDVTRFLRRGQTDSCVTVRWLLRASARARQQARAHPLAVSGRRVVVVGGAIPLNPAVL